ncbi:GNAT family N-acetyltransferase [Cellulomonas septica]|uniref:GNAT family N-acetyltransferase n=1 Tax=Cellulomonas septica TaxID=285080 RepID=A0ABX1JVF7_9CELL|nr:GNAT family N-acetyltransferase [Cellulomonas septica]NKY38293.1 GNAT family N-acetyltransferase [Cellulomonas septica]
MTHLEDPTMGVVRCSAEERDASGLLAMRSRWTARDRHGQPETAAGYEVWGGALAHLGVAVAAGARRRGLGSAVASVAATHALDAGLVPQWRCRVDNVASRRAAAGLGFVHAGDQVAIDLA